MQLKTPDAEVYHDATVAGLWRDLAKLYEAFVGDDKERKGIFERVLGDVQWALSPLLCAECSIPVINVGVGGDTDLRCPECGWSPVA